MESQNIEQILEKSKRKSKRLNEETGKYNKQPNDPDYYKKYWQENNFRVKCIRCDTTVGKLRMCTHIKSQKCLAVAKERMAYQTAIILLEQRNRDLDQIISELKS